MAHGNWDVRIVESCVTKKKYEYCTHWNSMQDAVNKNFWPPPHSYYVRHKFVKKTSYIIKAGYIFVTLITLSL
jgi:hypothetical protein